MATFLDVAGLEYFSTFFVFIFVWLLVYVLLHGTHALGGNKMIHALLGLVIALLTLLSPISIGAIKSVIPWFAVVLIFFVLIGVVTSSLGGDAHVFGNIKTVLIVFVAIAFLIGISGYIREKTVVPGDNQTSVNFKDTYGTGASILFHPKVLGIIFVLVIAVFTIALLTGTQMMHH